MTKEIRDPEINAESPNIEAVNDLVNAITEQKDPKEEAYLRMVEYLYNYDKLMFVSRLTGDLPQTILKNLSVIYFFHDYYTNIKVRIYYEKISTPPYYKKHVDYGKVDEMVREKLEGNYKKLIDDAMAITVAAGGKGRDEAKEILKSPNQNEEPKKLIHRLF